MRSLILLSLFKALLMRPSAPFLSHMAFAGLQVLDTVRETGSAYVRARLERLSSKDLAGVQNGEFEGEVGGVEWQGRSLGGHFAGGGANINIEGTHLGTREERRGLAEDELVWLMTMLGQTFTSLTQFD